MWRTNTVSQNISFLFPDGVQNADSIISRTHKLQAK